MTMPIVDMDRQSGCGKRLSFRQLIRYVQKKYRPSLSSNQILPQAPHFVVVEPDGWPLGCDTRLKHELGQVDQGADPTVAPVGLAHSIIT